MKSLNFLSQYHTQVLVMFTGTLLIGLLDVCNSLFHVQVKSAE